MKLEVGKTYKYDPEHPKCCFLTTDVDIKTDYTITITSIKDGWVFYHYITGWASEQTIETFITALVPLSALEKELY